MNPGRNWQKISAGITNLPLRRTDNIWPETAGYDGMRYGCLQKQKREKRK